MLQGQKANLSLAFFLTFVFIFVFILVVVFIFVFILDFVVIFVKARIEHVLDAQMPQALPIKMLLASTFSFVSKLKLLPNFISNFPKD